MGVGMAEEFSCTRVSILGSSLGVLQHDDVRFEPPLPMWKREAIHSMTMVS